MNNISIPLFPLNGVIFFPESSLPLNIFEERYIQMIDYSLTSTNRLIGMIQKDEKNQLYNVGCFGKIVSFNETSDGNYIINLIGKNYFKINNEPKQIYKFRIADIEILHKENQDAEKALVNFDRTSLLEKYQSYVEKLKIDIDFNIIKQIQNEELIKFISMSCPFTVAEKQMLLETYDLKILANKLLSLFEFYSVSEKNKNLIN